MQNVIFEPQLGGFGVGCRTDDLAPGVAQPSFGDLGGDVRTLEKFVEQFADGDRLASFHRTIPPFSTVKSE